MPKHIKGKIKRNGCDCRRENLVETTSRGNAQNKVCLDSRNKTGYRGVSIDPQTGLFRASVQVNYKTHYLGSFATLVEAKEAAAFFRSLHMPESAEGRLRTIHD